MIVHQSRYSAVALPEVAITEHVLAGLGDDGDVPVFIDGPTGRAMTANEFRARVAALAGGLAARGIGPGSVVSLTSANAPEFAVVFHAVARAGGTVTTISPAATAEEARRQMADAGARIAFAGAGLTALVREAAEGTAADEVVAIGEAEGATPLAALMGDPIAQVAVDAANDVVVLPYSSGTTGLPKGVMLTHRNLAVNVEQVATVLGTRRGARTLAFLPYFHIYGMTVLMNLYLSRGGLQVTLPRFELETALRLIETHRITDLFVAPPVVLALAKHPLVERFDLSSLRFVMSGAAPLGPDLAEACARRIGAEVFQGYGMTEMSPVSHISPPGANRAGASGVLVPGTEARVVDAATGEDAAEGEPGELWVRGPQVMKGYLGRPEATAEIMAEGGWLRTGDVVTVDAEGFTTVVDRVKELIKVKGFQVAPAELEALLATHPAVADVAVVGVEDDEAGEIPKAFVVAAAGAAPDLAALQAHLAGHVAHYKQIREMALVETIPKSPSGKILRRLLRSVDALAG